MSDTDNKSSQLESIIETLVAMARLDFSQKAEFIGDETDLDIVAMGINMLSEELKDSVVKRQDLERKNQELEQLAYVTSHDLKSPLRAINSLVEFVIEDLETEGIELPEDIQYKFRLIKERVKRMEGLLNGILKYSKIGGSYTEENLDLYKILCDVVYDLSLATDAEITIEGDFPMIKFDRSAFIQVIQNIVQNGIKHNENPHPTVKLSGKIRETEFVITATDNGPGIDPKFHDKIFDIFQSLSDPKTDNTGIGLSIVKKILEDHQCRISVHSPQAGGTSFDIHIPLNLIVDRQKQSK